MSVLRHWCFTSFGDAPQCDEKTVRYCVWQREVCPETKREHWQGYAELTKAVRITGAQAVLSLPRGTHMEKRLGKREAARGYCMKAESRKPGPQAEVGPFEFGSFDAPQQGHRTDLEMAVKCETLADIKEEHPTAYVKFHRGFEKLFEGKETLCRTKPDVYVLWGEGSNTGKTRSCTDFIDAGWSFYTKDSSRWWDGYAGQDVVWIDDFNPGDAAFGWLSAGVFKRLFDFGPNYVEPKGKSRVAFESKLVLITSNVDPRTWFPGERWAYIEKRIKSVRYCGTVDGDYEDRLADVRIPADAAAPVLALNDDGEDPMDPSPAAELDDMFDEDEDMALLELLADQ